MLLIQAEGSHVGTQGTLCVQGDAPRDPGGLAVHVGHSHTDLLTVLGEEGYVLGFGTRINEQKVLYCLYVTLLTVNHLLARGGMFTTGIHAGYPFTEQIL